ATPAPTATATATPTPTATPTTAPVADRTAPTVAIVSPTSGSSVSGTILLAARASDNVGVTGVSYWVGTTKLGDATLAADGTWQLPVNTAAFGVGTYPVTAKATDAAGNSTTSAMIALKRI
ncbi:Ig-like domain-containing protein, partial [Rathayibacter sp. ZW T2_19]